MYQKNLCLFFNFRAEYFGCSFATTYGPTEFYNFFTIKIKITLTSFYVYYNRSCPQNLNHWLLGKSEMINLQMLIQKNTFNVLSSSSPFEKTCSAMSASVSLARTPFWNMRKPGIQSCENVPGVPRPFDLLQLFILPPKG